MNSPSLDPLLSLLAPPSVYEKWKDAFIVPPWEAPITREDRLQTLDDLLSQIQVRGRYIKDYDRYDDEEFDDRAYQKVLDILVANDEKVGQDMQAMQTHLSHGVLVDALKVLPVIPSFENHPGVDDLSKRWAEVILKFHALPHLCAFLQPPHRKGWQWLVEALPIHAHSTSSSPAHIDQVGFALEMLITLPDAGFAQDLIKKCQKSKQWKQSAYAHSMFVAWSLSDTNKALPNLLEEFGFTLDSSRVDWAKVVRHAQEVPAHEVLRVCHVEAFLKEKGAQVAQLFPVFLHSTAPVRDKVRKFQAEVRLEKGADFKSLLNHVAQPSTRDELWAQFEACGMQSNTQPAQGLRTIRL